jgi:hypothetical protein
MPIPDIVENTDSNKLAMIRHDQERLAWRVMPAEPNSRRNG